jgi:hypothetical protein
VKVEVTDRSALAVFVIIDSEMSFVMEKSCAYFVSQAKVDNCQFFVFFHHEFNYIKLLMFCDVLGLQWLFSSQ